MQIHHLKYMVKISQLGSFSAAAQALYVSQPALSQQIRELEKELGVKLFIRQRHGVMLTTAGKEFVEIADSVLRGWNRLYTTMERYRFVDKGHLTIGVLWIWGYLGINSYINDFQKLYPNLELQLVPDGSVPLLEKLKREELDCCIIIAEERLLQDAALSYHRMITDQIMVIMHSGHPLSYQSSISWKDLKDIPIILPGKDSASYQMVMEHFTAEHIAPRTVCESTQSAVTVQLVSDGIGAGFCSKAMADTFQDSRFVALPLNPPVFREIYYVTRKKFLGQSAVSEFTKYMEHYPSL